jgi:hypothetical protein
MKDMTDIFRVTMDSKEVMGGGIETKENKDDNEQEAVKRLLST